MRARWATLAVVMAAGVALSGDNAYAQGMSCRQIAGELASAAPAANPASLQQAAVQRRQYSQVQAAMAAYGCSDLGGPFISPQCAPLKSQAAALAQSVNQLERAAKPAIDPARRAQLQAAYDGNCRTAPPPAAREQQRTQADPQPRGLFDALFNPRPAAPAAQTDNAPQYATNYDPFNDLEAEAKRRAAEAERAKAEKGQSGGRLPVCVRSCDGFFFPVNYQGAQDQYNDVCRASCPDAKAELYYMTPGADIETAVSARGAPYTALAAASAFKKSFDATCSCKRPSQAWGTALQSAEALIRKKGDIVVTDESSKRMAEPVNGLRGVNATSNQEDDRAADNETEIAKRQVRSISLR